MKQDEYISKLEDILWQIEVGMEDTEWGVDEIKKLNRQFYKK